MVWGHLGDRLGRKRVLLAILLTMGVATFLVGCIPSTAAIGPAAPVVLILLRLVQGISAGGEQAGSALLALELPLFQKLVGHGIVMDRQEEIGSESIGALDALHQCLP